MQAAVKSNQVNFTSTQPLKTIKNQEESQFQGNVDSQRKHNPYLHRVLMHLVTYLH